MMTLNLNPSNFLMEKSAEVTPIASHIKPWLAKIAYPLGRFLVLPSYFSGGIEVIGQENLPTDGPVILAPTHRSRWDALILPYATGRYVTGRDLRFMVTSDEVKGLQGWLIRGLGGFPINPKSPAIASLRHGIELLLEQQMLVIFPEGNIFQDDQVHPLKQGLARLAIQAELSNPGMDVKIVPMSIHYENQKRRWGSRVKVIIGKPLSVADYGNGSIKKAAPLLTNDLENALKFIDQI